MILLTHYNRPFVFLKKAIAGLKGAAFVLTLFSVICLLNPVEAESLSLDETIDALIALFEAKDYRGMVTQYSHPDAIAKMETDGADKQKAIGKLIALQEEFGGITLKRLKEAKKMKPRYLNDGRDALFDFKGGYFLRFRKDISGKWCLL